MSRDDSLLYTGMNSSTLNTPQAEAVKDKREASKQERLDNKQKLKPAAEPVLALITKHKNNAMHILAVAQTDDISDKAAGELLRSQRKIYNFLVQFEQEIKIALKDVT